MSLLCLAAALAPFAVPHGLATAQEAPPPAALFRIRIANRSGGPVEVSASEEQGWQALGKVVRPATAASSGTDVLSIAAAATVFAVGPDRIALRLPSDKTNRSLEIISKSETASPAAIATDLPTRAPLFRSLAPPVGSRVLIQRDAALGPIPLNYVPRVGDVLLIMVPRPSEAEPPTVTIENKVDGDVVLTATGGAPRVLAKVRQPLRGVGRYANTERAGSGSVVAWSPVNVLVSTSGPLRRVDEMGRTLEERGGFVIQPVEPGLKGATNPASQLLIEGVPEGESRPVVSRFFALPAPLTTCDPLDPAPTRVDVRLDGGDWEPFPDLRGAVTEADLLRAIQQSSAPDRAIKQGITHIRLRLGAATPTSLERLLRLAALPPAGPAQRGKVTITANVMGEGIRYVSFFLNGKQVQITNLPPYAWEWNTLESANGEHLVEIRGMDENLVLVNSVTTKVVVDN